MNQAPRSLSSKIGKSALALFCAGAATAILLGSTCNLTNKAPSVPVISGPSSGVVGVPVTFKATATDPEGDSIAFQFDWGDTTTPAWSTFIASGETLSRAHTYADSGSYLVKAVAKDAKGKESGWSDSLALGLISSGPAYPDSVYDSVYVSWPMQSCGLSPDGSLLALGPASGRDSLTILRVSDRTSLPRIRVGSAVAGLVFSPDSRSVYASSWGQGHTCRVDVPNGRVVDSIPGTGTVRDIALTPDGDRLLLCAQQNVYVLRTDSLTILDSVRLPHNVQRMALNRAGTVLYVSVLHGVCVVDVPACSLRAFVQAVDEPMFPVLSPDEESLYVVSGIDSGVAVLRTSDLTVTRRVSLHVHGANHLERTPDGAHLYIGIGGTRVLDTRTLLPVDTIRLEAGGPLAMHPSGDSAYYVGGSRAYVIGKRR